MRLLIIALLLTVIAGCASTSTPAPDQASNASEQAPESGPEPGDAAPEPAAPLPEVPQETGQLEIDVANALGQNLPCRVDLLDNYGSPTRQLELPTGVLESTLPIGDYRCYIHVYDEGVPVLSEIQEVRVKQEAPAHLLVNILEGSGGRMGIHGFDSDGDLAIDRVELASGTQPNNAASVPGKPMLPFKTDSLKNEARWYRGELNAQTRYGAGTESVSELVKRAEKAGLDFLAITDRNNMKSITDKGYNSSSLVLIPAMEWGTKEMGYALIYGPRTLPEPPGTTAAAQAECLRVQAQGGAFAVARPCFPDAPWLWGLSYVNSIQVWCRGWREIPPMNLTQLPQDYQDRAPGTTPGEQGPLIHSIAAAAAGAQLDTMSANVQSTRFWDYELVRGLMAAGIAGSNSGGPAVPLGSPVTYIYAKEKSLPALLEGLRLGRTYMSAGLDGPKISFSAEVGKLNVVKDAQGKDREEFVPLGAPVGIGGAVPLNVTVRLEIAVAGGAGKNVELLVNGRPVMSKIIEGTEGLLARTIERPTSYSVYRVRVVGEPTEKGYGPLEVFAMSSPIYAQDVLQEVLWQFPNLDLSKTFIKIPEDSTPEKHFDESIPPLQPGRHFIPPQQQANPSSAPGGQQ